MKLRKIIRRRIREQRNGVSVAGDVNVAISGNVGERGATTHVSSRQDAYAGETETKGTTEALRRDQTREGRET
jgi:hypothetical protein